MRQFQISAIIDEKILWELMTLLERSKARAILARPYDAEDGEAPAKSARKIRLKSNGGGVANTIDAAILAALGKSETITVKSMMASMPDLSKQQVYHGFHRLANKAKLVKRVDIGTYTLTKKGATAS